MKQPNNLNHCNMRDYIGRDQQNINIMMYQEEERKFVVTHRTETTPVTYFLGREAELQKLRQSIEEKRKCVLVSGMGGIGKTQVCRFLFKEYEQKEIRPFEHIGYIEYNGNMDSSLTKCLRFKKQEDPKRNIEAAWKELEDVASNGRLLLFIDNVNVSRGTDLGLQRLNSIPGTIVLTSRRTSFHGFEIHRIGFLSTEECKDIYEKIRFRNSGKRVEEEERQDLEYIIEQLAAKHTMTIQLLAHLAQTKRWTVSRLREELEKNEFQLEYKDDEDTLINIQKSYEILYNLSELNETEQNILEAFCVFPYLPLSFEVCNQWLLSDAGVGEEEDILTGLERKGWLQFDVEQETYTLHPVFAQFIYQKQKPKQENHSGLIEACERSLELLEGGSVFECQKWIPFAENIIKKIDIEIIEKKINFIYVLGKVLKYIGEYKKAEKWYSECLKICKDILGENHPTTATSYNSLALVYDEEGKYTKAKEYYEKSLRIRQRVLGENHLATINSYNNLAVVYGKEGEYVKAKGLYEKSLKVSERVLGENHLDTATIYNNLAYLYQEQGEYAKAKELYEKSLRIRERVLGENHLITAISYNNLAVVYERKGEYIKAKDLYEKSLGIKERVLGENHPTTAAGYHNLAGLYKKEGEYVKAKDLYEKSLKIRERVLEENHPDIATNYHNLAEIYEKEGEYVKAKDLYEKSLKISERVLGENHPTTAISYNNLACLYQNQGEYPKAKELYKKSLKISERVLGENHPTTATGYNNLAYLYQEQGEYPKAKELYEKSLRISEEVLGKNHPNTATSYNNLAYLYQEQGEYPKAKELYEKSLEICRRVLGENHPDTANSYNNLAYLYKNQGEYPKAKELYEKSLRISERVLGENHPYTATVYNNLAAVYEREGEYKIALSYYLKAYKILVSNFGINHPHTKLGYENMKYVYLKLNLKEDFDQWLEEKMRESNQK